MAAPVVPPGLSRASIRVRGAVQGVGFRPFVYRAAVGLGLAGTVRNTLAGVEIELEGPVGTVERFLDRMRTAPPPLARIRDVDTRWSAPRGTRGFRVDTSADAGGAAAAEVPPDVATCPACLAEVRDPSDRRYRYPFTNCTDCGPRYSIIEALPYDRPATTMRGFPLCDACRAEYGNPLDRRFHAQPVACPDCGPRTALWAADGAVLAGRDEALRGAARLVREGRIVAVKGLGGFHLLADATRARAVRELRARKRRPEKPLAVMFPDAAAVERHCAPTPEERTLLASPAAPIVLVRRRSGPTDLVEDLAPGSPWLGALLPYTPLHHLLLEDVGNPVVATSGNRSDEPICIDEHEALARLAGIADAFLVHDRPIARPVDDSVFRVVLGRPLPLRLARGYAPLSIPRGAPGPTGLAVGAHRKATVALARPDAVVVSQHLGDLDSPAGDALFRSTVTTLERLYRVDPGRTACDLHPDYRSTRYAEEREPAPCRVQHHEAHVIACAADVGASPPLTGVAWDGTGLGRDGTVWGGEVFAWRDQRLERRAHLRTFRLPGGEAAVREPRRCALGILWEIFGEDLWTRDAPALRSFDTRERRMVTAQLARGLNAPVTSSAGRLFDAAAALAGVRGRASFEGQAAMELEYALDRPAGAGAYPLAWTGAQGPAVLDWEPLVHALLADVDRGVSLADVSARFHNALAEGIVEAARIVGEETVLLTGGCFQNAWLTERTVHRLREAGFRPGWHGRVPPNDGGLSLGQVWAAVRSD